jgi:hypothetical protein
VDRPGGVRELWTHDRTSERAGSRKQVHLMNSQNVSQRLVELSKWIDAGNMHRDPEARTWGRLAKVAEEGGEVISAFIGVTGQNPRKGVSNTMYDVNKELMDVAITALGAYEHLNDHPGDALNVLCAAILTVADRALAVTEPMCLNPECDQPLVDSGEGRFCSNCQDYEGTCRNDHCLSCGART